MAAEKITIEVDAGSSGISITVTLRDSEGNYIDSDTARIPAYDLVEMLRDRFKD